MKYSINFFHCFIYTIFISNISFYYFRIIVNMYIAEAPAIAVRRGPGIRLALALCFTGTLVFGLWPTGIINFLSRGAMLAQ